MKLNVKFISYAIGLFICGLLIFSQIKCNKLQKQLNEERINNLEQIDSLTYINKQRLEIIKTYDLKVSELNSEIDSLERVKNKIIIRRDNVIVSSDASSAANLLKTNLELWDD